MIKRLKQKKRQNPVEYLENERRAIVAPPCREIGFKLPKMQRCYETAKNCSRGSSVEPLLNKTVTY